MSKQVWIKSGALMLLFGVLFVSMAFRAKGKKVILFGDSITQAGVKPGGYVDLLKQKLEPEGYTIQGAGIGGNKVYDLYLRLEEDVLVHKPDVVVLYVGVNDVWHKWSSRTGTDQDKFVRFYQALIKKIKAGGAKVVVCTPAVIGEKKTGTNEMDAELDIYANEIRKMAAEQQLPIADLRKIFTSYDAANNPQDLDKGILTSDGVHLNDKGNATVADAILPLIR